MADNRAATPETFDPAKGYTAVLHMGGTDALPSEFVEQQRIQQHHDRMILDRIFKEGVIAEYGGHVDDASPGIAVGSDTLVADTPGTFTGLETITYLVRIVRGGAPGVAQFDYSTSGPDPSDGPVTVTAFEAWHDLGHFGARIKFVDGPPLSPDGVLVEGDTWSVTCYFENQLPVAVTNEDGTGTIALQAAAVYINGRIATVPAAELIVASPMPDSSNTTIYVEALTKTVTWDDDATLIVPRTSGPAARREMLVLSFKATDTTGDTLPTRCTKRTVRPAYEWDRDPASATYNAVGRVHANWSKLDLNQLDGVLPGEKVAKLRMSDELKGILANRTADESGSYLVAEEHLRSVYMPDQNTAGYAAVMTQAGRAYVSGIRYENRLSETIPVPIADTVNTVQNEENRFYYGTLAYLLQKAAGELDFPVKSITTLTAPSLVLEQVARGSGDTDAFSYTPVSQILCVSKGTPAMKTGSGGTFIFSAATNEFKVTATTWAGAAGAEQTIYFAVGSFTVDQVIEALNQCTGPAYMSGSANNNLYYYESGGEIVVRTYGTSASHTIAIGAGTANEALGMDAPASTASTGTQYAGTTDYVLDGSGIRWVGASRPSYGEGYQVIYAHTKTMVAGTDYVLGGEIAVGTTAWCVSAVRKQGDGEGAEYVESYPSNIVTLEAVGGEVVELSWPEMDNIEYFRVYRGGAESYDGMKLIACVRSTGATTASWADTGYYDKTNAALNPTTGSPNLSGPTLMTPVTLTEWPAGAVNFDTGYGFTEDGGDIVSNRPFDLGTDPGTNFIADYEYYQPRYTLRCLMPTEVIVDVHGIPADEPLVPAAPAFSLPLAKILCPANSYDVEVMNYGNRAYHMDEIKSIAAQVEDLRYNAAQLEIANQALEGESSTLRAVYADAFTTVEQGDLTHPDFSAGIDPIAHCLRPPMAVTSVPLTVDQAATDGTTEAATLPAGCRQGKTLVLMGYTEEQEVDQDQFTTELPVNPYEHFDEQVRPDAWIILSPARDYWVETTQIRAEGFVQEYFYIGVENTPQKITAAERKAALDRGVVPIGEWDEIRNELAFLRKDSIRYCRSIVVEILGQQFLPSSEVVCTFAGVSVNLTPVAPYVAGGRAGSVRANAYGQFRATLTIPTGKNIPTGSLTVKCTAYSTTEPTIGEECDTATATFVSEGVVNVFEETQIKATYYIDPITQQIRFVSDGYLTRVDVPLAAKDASLPIMYQIRGTDDQGYPTSDVSWVESRTPAQTNVGVDSENLIIPDDPLWMSSDEMKALTLMSASAQGYKAYIAVGGGKNLAPGAAYGATVSENPYLAGDLLTSSTNWTWLVHPDRDLRFRVWRAKFSTAASETIYFNPVSWTGHTEVNGLMLVVGQEVPDGTSVLWQYRTDGDTTWKTIIPLRYFTLKNETCEMVYLRAILSTTNDRLSPAISKGNWALVLSENATDTTYLTQTEELVAEVDSVKVHLEEYNPAGSGEVVAGTITGAEVGPYVIDGLTLNLKVDGATIPEITFSGVDPISAATIVEAINAAVVSEIPAHDAVATVVNGRVCLASATSIEVDDGTANTVLGLREGIYLGHQAGQHDVMLSPDGGHTWMSPTSRSAIAGEDAFSRVTYEFGGGEDFNLLSCKVRIRQKTAYRYLVPLAKKLAITMV